MTERIGGNSLSWCCPITGENLGISAASIGGYPSIDGIPVLVPRPSRFLARHWPGAAPLRTSLPEPLPVDAPDPWTPHLPPGERVRGTSLEKWASEIEDPAEVCARFGADLAPEGPMLDAGCGVGVMARKMALLVEDGESIGEVFAFDRSPQAVLVARSVCEGGLSAVPAGRAGLEEAWGRVQPAVGIHWAIADVLSPPLPKASLAWIHCGNLFDMVPGGAEEVLASLVPLLIPGGLLTFSTPFDEDDVPVGDGGETPEKQLNEALRSVGLSVVDQRDSVPWVIREYNRGFRILLCYCVAARKPLVRRGSLRTAGTPAGG